MGLSLGFVVFLYFEEKRSKKFGYCVQETSLRTILDFFGFASFAQPKDVAQLVLCWIQDATVSLVARAACAARAESRGAFAWRGRHPSTPGSE